jgi:cyanophycinase
VGLIAPLYLLADSQLLFWPSEGNALTDGIRASLPSSAAYVGASNKDRPEFYELFVAAMEAVGVSNCRMVSSELDDEDKFFVNGAGLILLAGGDVEHGWRVFERNGLKDLLVRKRYDGCIFIGVSAGAVQLGLGTLTAAPQPKKLEMLGFAPFYVGAHDEDNEWWDLRALVTMSQSGIRAVGIPKGGGAIYDSNGEIEPICRPLTELVKEDNDVIERLLIPPKRDQAQIESQNG